MKKAYFVWDVHNEDEGGDFVHAESPNKAKAKALRNIPFDCGYVDLRCVRLPALDDKPLTDYNVFHHSRGYPRCRTCDLIYYDKLLDAEFDEYQRLVKCGYCLEDKS